MQLFAADDNFRCIFVNAWVKTKFDSYKKKIQNFDFLHLATYLLYFPGPGITMPP